MSNSSQPFIDIIKKYHDGLRAKGILDESATSAFNYLNKNGLPGTGPVLSEDWDTSTISRWRTIWGRPWRPWPLTQILSKEDIKNAIKNSLVEGFEKYWSIVFINGQFSKLLSTLPLENQLQISEQITPFEINNGLLALNQAMAFSSVKLHIPSHVELEEPLCLIHLETEDCDGFISNTALEIEIEKCSKATVFECFMSLAPGPKQSLHNDLTLLTLKSGSQLDYVRKQDFNQGVTHIHQIKTTLSKDAHLEAFSLNQGAKDSRVEFTSNLNEAGAEIDFTALAALGTNQQTTHKIDIHHHKGHTNSKQLLKGLAQDESQIQFYATIHVDKNAQMVDAEQLSKGLLLSPKAHILNWPRIRAAADDIKCGHGAAIGQLNPEEKFYLESRGITPARSQEMLMRGFIDDALNHIKHPLLKQTIELSLHKKGDINALD